MSYHEGETGAAANLYAYCNNDPVNYVDPSGTSTATELAGLILTFVGFLALKTFASWAVVIISIGIGLYSLSKSESAYFQVKKYLQKKLDKKQISRSKFNSLMRYNNTIRWLGWAMAGVIVIGSLMGVSSTVVVKYIGWYIAAKFGVALGIVSLAARLSTKSLYKKT